MTAVMEYPTETIPKNHGHNRAVCFRFKYSQLPSQVVVISGYECVTESLYARESLGIVVLPDRHI